MDRLVLCQWKWRDAEGWLNRGGTWYYLTGSGAMAEGWGNIGGTWYYFQPGNGAMQVGWVKDGNVWYCMNGSGAMQRGWLNRGGPGII